MIDDHDTDPAPPPSTNGDDMPNGGMSHSMTMTMEQRLEGLCAAFAEFREEMTTRLDAIEKRLADGDERMSRIEANMGLIGNAAIVALRSNGHDDYATKFERVLDLMYGSNGEFRDEPTSPGG